MKIAGIVCGCGESELISIQPGQDPVYAPTPLNFMLHPGTRDVGRCKRCFTKSFSGVNPMFAEMADGS